MNASTKHSFSHHLTSLSGSSQSPLIGSNMFDAGGGGSSERSTPIPLHSLQFMGSPTGNQNHNPNHNSSNQQLPKLRRSSQNSVVGTPLPPPRSATPSSAGSNSKSTGFIFPCTTKQMDTFSSGFLNKSPTLITDINLNAEHERNRELSSSKMQQQVSPNHIIVGATRASSSRLNSPAMVASNVGGNRNHRNVFFAESQANKSLAHMQQSTHTRRCSINLTTDFGTTGTSAAATLAAVPPTNNCIATTGTLSTPFSSIVRLTSGTNDAINSRSGSHLADDRQENQQNISTDSWAHHDDNYHLYHEPIDPDDEQEQAKQSHQTRSIRHNTLSQFFSELKSPSIASRVTAPRSADHIASHCPQPAQIRSSRSQATNISNGPSTLNDWSLRLPSLPNSRSSLNNHHSSLDPVANSPSITNDVSADIYQYLCYVSLRSNERVTHRSRSYHGPKYTPIARTSAHQPSYPEDTLKNLSSTSVVDLPKSPTLTASMIPSLLRDNCVRELVETESNYVHALEMILNCFSKPMESTMKRDEHHTIFGHIKYFHQIHSSFQAELVRAAYRSHSAKDTSTTKKNSSQATNGTQTNSNPTTPTTPTTIDHTFQHQFSNTSPLSSPTALESPLPMIPNSIGRCVSGVSSHRISSCFLNFKEKFLKYDDYCASLSKTQALIDELASKNEAMAVQLDRCQQEANDGKFKLRDLLSLPMQRILKYHILLAKLVENTNSKADDYGLRRAYECMVDIGQYINEVKRDTETMQIINDIERSITGLNFPSQLTEYGHLITDGFIKVKFPHDTKAKLPHDIKLKQKKYVFVFDKVVLICKETGYKRYQLKEALILNDFEIEANPVPAVSEINPRQSLKEKKRYNFNLVRLSDKAVYSFIAKSLEVKNRWVESIQKAFDNIKPMVCRNDNKSHDFSMHTFEKASSCDHCGKLLLGLYYQGYKCRTCSKSAHKDCLGAIRPCVPALPPRPNTKSRYRSNCNELPSPSVRSDCSDGLHNSFSYFPTNHSSSTSCVDILTKNEYNNLGSRLNSMNLSSSFKENRMSRRSDNSIHGCESKENHFEICEMENSYVNFMLNRYPWFHGRMNRDRAQSLLERASHGTFLVRNSPKHNGSYVISLNYNSQVKHMRIYVKDNQFFLSQNRYFTSVIELVSFYEKNSLVESFHMLDARLASPFKG